MTIANQPGRVPEAAPLAPLSTKTITVLTDSFMHAFGAMATEETKRRKQAKARLAAELAKFDPLSPSEHYADHEEYVPGGGAA